MWHLVSKVSWFTVFVMLALAGMGTSQSKSLTGSAQAITHGPILGRPGAHEMTVWARTAQPSTFRVRYGLTADRLDQTSPPVTTRLEHDNTGHVRLTGLKADTRYHYRVVTEGAIDGPGGSFRTLPDPKDYRNDKHNPRGLFNLRFEFACGNNQGKNSLGPDAPIFRTMLARLRDRIHFAILNGDWLYEDHRDFSPAQWLKQMGRTQADLPELVKLAPAITGVWQNYKVYLERGKNLSAWHREIPSYFTLDDHEILNDVVGCGQVGMRDRRVVFRDPAIQAWFDYLGWSNPTEFTQGIHFGKAYLKAGSDVLHDPTADFSKIDLKQAATLHVHWGTSDAGVDDPKLDKEGGDPNAGVYEIVEIKDRHHLRIRPAPKKDGTPTYSIGRRTYYRVRMSNCDFFFLDTRSHRQKHDIKNPAKPGLTMLGTEQREWLLAGMSKSDADFFFVVSSVNFMIPHTGAGGMSFAAEDKDDAWTVFLDEREQLIKAWEKLKRPVFVLTGDLHNSFAVHITGNIWEFASGPHNSRNHPAGSEGNRPATGVFNSGGRKCDIRWSTYFLEAVPSTLRHQPVYCVVQVNNVFNNPLAPDTTYWVAYAHPQVVFQYYDGFTGELLYAEAIRGGK